MSVLDSLLRTIRGGMYRDQPAVTPYPRGRKYDLEMPGLRTPPFLEPDSIETGENPGIDSPPQQASGELPWNPNLDPDAAATGKTKSTPKSWVQKAGFSLPAMLQGAVAGGLAAPPVTRGAGPSILAGLQAGMDSRQQHDVMDYNTQRQRGLDRQNAEYKQAQIEEQKARSEKERADAQWTAQNRGKVAVNPEEEIIRDEKLLGRKLTERELLKKLGYMGLEYDPRTLQMAVATGRLSQETANEIQGGITAAGASAKQPNISQLYASVTKADLDAAQKEFDEAMASGNEARIAAATEKLAAVRAELKAAAVKPVFGPKPTVQNFEQGAYKTQWNKEKGDYETVPATAQTDNGTIDLKPQKKVFAPQRQQLERVVLNDDTIGVLNKGTGEVTRTDEKAKATGKSSGGSIANQIRSMNLGGGAAGAPAAVPGGAQNPNPGSNLNVKPGQKPIIDATEIRKKLAQKRGVPVDAIQDREVEEVIRRINAAAAKR